MFERIGDFLSVEGFVLLQAAIVTAAVVVLGLILGGLLWLLQRRRCGTVCLSLHGKPGDVWRRLTGTTTGELIAGLIGCLLWAPVVGLNILFAAVLFEVFFPGGQRTMVPGMGIFRSNALNAALILAAVESFFAIVLGVLGQSSPAKRQQGESATTRFDPRLLLMLLVAVTVLFEFGLAIYRASLMGAGTQPGLPSVLQDVIRRGGPVVAGLLGVIVPLGQDLLAYAAIHWLVVPWVETSLAAFLWMLVGWHDPLPPGVDVLQKGVAGARKRSLALRLRVQKLNSTTQGMHMPPTLDDIDKESGEIGEQIQTATGSWASDLESLEQSLVVAGSKADLHNIENQAIKGETGVFVQNRSVVGRIVGLLRNAKTLARRCAAWNKARDQVLVAKTAYETAKENADGWSSAITEILALLDWNGQDAPPSAPTAATRLGGPAVQTLAELKKESLDVACPGRQTALDMLNRCGPVMAGVQTKIADARMVNQFTSGMLTGQESNPGLVAKFRDQANAPAGSAIAKRVRELCSLRGRAVSEALSAIRCYRAIRRKCRKRIPWVRRALEALLPPWALPRDGS